MKSYNIKVDTHQPIYTSVLYGHGVFLKTRIPHFFVGKADGYGAKDCQMERWRVDGGGLIAFDALFFGRCKSA